VLFFVIPRRPFYDTGSSNGRDSQYDRFADHFAVQCACGRTLFSWVAGAIAAQDLANGYWWSPSNVEVEGILGPDIQLYSSAIDANSDVNNLNSAGIVTVFNAFGTGFRVWGKSFGRLSYQHRARHFISVRRTMDVIEESVELAMLQLSINRFPMRSSPRFWHR